MSSIDELRWQLFPKNKKISLELMSVIGVFSNKFLEINSSINYLKSNEVLRCIRDDLTKIGYEVEKGKKTEDKIKVPVLYGENGIHEKYFEADAYSKKLGIVIEVEAGRALMNNQFLKDIFQACVMDGVNHLVIAVRNKYKNSKDYDKIKTFLETLYVSRKFHLELESILLIGY